MQRRQETVGRHLQQSPVEGKPITPTLQQPIEEQQELSTAVVTGTQTVQLLKEKQVELEAKQEQIVSNVNRYADKQKELDSRRRIFQHDVEQDSLFSVLKVGLVLLITYVLKEYFGDARMDAETFLERVATLPAKMRRTRELEIITFEYNRRDPDVMALLAEHCEAINRKNLRMLSGKILRLVVEPAPPPRRQPPINRRVIPGDRFRRR